MKFRQKSGFLLKNIAGDNFLIARGKQALDFSAAVIFNDTGAFMWESLSDEKSIESLAEILDNKYNIGIETAKNDAELFIKKGISEGIIIEVMDNELI